MKTDALESPALTVFFSPTITLDTVELSQQFAGVQQVLFDELGILCPLIHVHERSDLTGNEFQLQINDQLLEPVGGLAPDELWINVAVQELAAYDIVAQASTEPNYGTEAAIVRPQDIWTVLPEVSTSGQKPLPDDPIQLRDAVTTALQKAGIATRDPGGYVIFYVAAAIRKQAGVLLGPELVQHYLRLLEEEYPALVNAVRQQFDAGILLQRFQARLNAQTSIKNLPGVLEDLLAEKVLAERS